jgi:DNA modification methylase
MQATDEALPSNFQYRLDLASHVTPKLLTGEPVHRWFYYQHSFSPQLVERLLDAFRVQGGALILDPFVGAGTTLAVARQRGVNAIGIDLSPLSVFVSKVKVSSMDARGVRRGLNAVESAMAAARASDVDRPGRLQRAFTDAEFGVLKRLREAIDRRAGGERRFLTLSFLRCVRKFSRAVPDGGWFRWRDFPSRENEIRAYFRATVEEMLEDEAQAAKVKGFWRAYQEDARDLSKLLELEPDLVEGCDAIISSPPYPNRHDYSRIHQIELLMLGVTEDEIAELRRRSLRSHVEARRPLETQYSNSLPPRLLELLAELPQSGLDRRVRPMLAGYFEDLGEVLRECRQALKPGGHLALVVGNVRHGGVMIPVDELLVTMGEQAGLTHVITWVARLRGNSAQQMGRFGRQPARESIVIFRREA